MTKKLPDQVARFTSDGNNYYILNIREGGRICTDFCMSGIDTILEEIFGDAADFDDFDILLWETSDSVSVPKNAVRLEYYEGVIRIEGVYVHRYQAHMIEFFEALDDSCSNDWHDHTFYLQLVGWEYPEISE